MSHNRHPQQVRSLFVVQLPILCGNVLGSGFPVLAVRQSVVLPQA